MPPTHGATGVAVSTAGRRAALTARVAIMIPAIEIATAIANPATGHRSANRIRLPCGARNRG